MARQFVHLHAHTEYSMLDGLARIPDLVAQAKKWEQPALAVTDHGGMYGTLHFYNACKKADLKPLIGCELYMAKKSRFDKQIKMGSDQFHLTVLAQNYEGYQNLNRLVAAANFEGFSYKPRIDAELLEQYSDNLIVLTGCMSSLFNRLLQQDKDSEAEAFLLQLKNWFPDRLFVELQRHPGIPELKALEKKQLALARKHKLPIVATNDVHYVHHSEAEAQDALLCVQTRRLISDKNRMSMIDVPDFYLKSSEEMIEQFADLPEAIDNTVKIAEMCDVVIPTGQLIFPHFPIPKGKTDATFLKELVYELAPTKFPDLSQEVTDRIEYELGIIGDKGYDAYFLITHDFVQWSKQQGIGVGPGRGSAAGSVVSYILDITTINPFQHGLAFERFLNPQRPTPPDIDLDFADDRRDEVIQYVSEKYGSDRVGHVITFGRMEARVSVRDIGRVLGLPYEDPDRIAKLIPNNPGTKTSIEKALQIVPELAEYYKQPKFKQLIDLAKQVEGVIRHSSVHAAAIVITDKPLTDYCAIQKDTKSGKTITQFDMYALDCNVSEDALGLLKFDFLGLRNLTIMQEALRLIKKHRDISVDMGTLPLDDTATYDLLSRGDTMGVFQLESAGMRRVARSLKPSQFSDITAMVALYRPGPMDLIPQFIEGKHNPDKIEYVHDSLQPILAETYGVMVYQEQILQIANIMAGYTLGEADILRKAIGKKKKKLLDENRERFVSQSVKKGYKKQVAQKVWKFIEAFANYGFNKAHSVSYAMIAYQTAYLKANYVTEYMTALMSVEAASHSANRDVKVAVAIETCKKMGIVVLPPDINKSESSFTIEQHEQSLDGKAVRFGLSAIKHVGTAAIENILETRQSVGSFESLTQFIYETDGRKANKTTLECLIKVGAFDAFGTRAAMLENLEDIRKTASKLTSDIEGQDTLFAGVEDSTRTLSDTFPQVPEYPKPELLSFEKELLGIYLTDHPLATALKQVGKAATKHINDLDQTIDADKTYLFGGVLNRVRVVQTKKSGKNMAFAQVEDSTGSMPMVIFPKLFEEHQSIIRDEAVLLIKAKVDLRDEEMQLIAERITVPDTRVTAAQVADHEIFIPRKTTQETLEKLGTLLKKNPGNDSVKVIIPNGGKPDEMLLPYGVRWDDKLQKNIERLLN